MKKIRRIHKILIDFARGEVVVFKNGGALRVYNLSGARAERLQKSPRYHSHTTSALGLGKNGYIR